MTEIIIFFAGVVVGVFLGYRWGKHDATQDAPADGVAYPQGGGGPNPEK